MKKTVLITLMVLVTLCAGAQNAAQARRVLDKTAAIVGNKGGASANFKISNSKMGSTSGSISIKGNKFHARTNQAIVWFNGKTQWSYLKSTNEVNITTPTEAQRMRMNPYTFITMYKNGYNLGMTSKGANYQVHMTAQNKQRTVQEIYLTINKRTYKPTTVKMREGGIWTTITISNFQAKKMSDSQFTFKAKDFPTAEVIDLR
ncbi:MAG: LolA-like putative outer membrane lipoprotein chaperone [Prevotella sp.]|jgi:outer membrane lipoprotein-sorting protein